MTTQTQESIKRARWLPAEHRYSIERALIETADELAIVTAERDDLRERLEMALSALRNICSPGQTAFQQAQGIEVARMTVLAREGGDE